MALCERPYPEALDATEIEDAVIGLPGYYLFTKKATADGTLVVRMLSKAARDQALADLFRLAVAIKQFKAASGSYATRLDELVPDHLPQLPMDPFMGKGYHYSKTGDGFQAYSSGANREDDGGHRRLDIVWEAQA